MSQILVNDEWYEELNTHALYEDEFETLFLREAKRVVPNHYAVKFKKLVESEYGDARADLALIDHDYRYWIVVEVELGHHSFNGHVLPQVNKLRSGIYDTSHAEYLHAQDSCLDPKRLTAMIRGESPSVIVLANCKMPEWDNELARINVTLHCFQIFRSDKDHFIFNVELSLPMRPSESLTYCKPDHHMCGWLRVISPGALPETEGEPVKLAFEGTVTLWKRLDVQEAVYLMPIGRNFLKNSKSYEIQRDELGDLVLLTR